MAKADRKRPFNLVEASSHSGEPFRALRLALQLRSDRQDTKMFVVTSAEPGEGKSTVAANFALVSAQAQWRVLLIDADVRRPQMHEFFAMPRSPGLVEALASGEPVKNYVKQIPVGENLDLLTAGMPVPRFSDLAASARMASIFESASSAYDLVVVDSPPILVASDAAGLCIHPGVEAILVASRGTKRRTIKRALRELRLVEAKIAGVVANREGRLATYGYAY